MCDFGLDDSLKELKEFRLAHKSINIWCLVQNIDKSHILLPVLETAYKHVSGVIYIQLSLFRDLISSFEDTIITAWSAF